MQKKKIAEFLVALFVAIIFITSYLASANLGSSLGSNSTKGKGTPQTVYAIGFANGTISNYTDTLNVSVLCGSPNSAKAIGNLTNEVGRLEANHSVSTYFQAGNNITILSGSEETNSIYSRLYKSIDTAQANCTTFSTGAVVLLPSQVKLYVASQLITLGVGRNVDRYVVPVTLSQNMSSVLKLRIAALITSNGSVYGNLSVTRAA